MRQKKGSLSVKGNLVDINDFERIDKGSTINDVTVIEGEGCNDFVTTVLRSQ
jgi:hypothetical protein